MGGARWTVTLRLGQDKLHGRVGVKSKVVLCLTKHHAMKTY
jgi:hypothetical protein